MPRSSLRLSLTLAIVLVALLGAGCGSGAAGAGGGEGTPVGEQRVVSTEKGDVSVPAAPQRIIVLNSALAGYFFALDVPLHGAIPLNTEAKEFPDLWAAEAEAAGTVMIPWSNDGFELEALLAEKPDLIVAGGQGFPGSQAAEAYDKLSAIAPTVLVSSKLTRWQDELDFIAGDILGTPEKGEALVSTYQARVAEVRDTITPPPTPVSYLLMLPDGRPWSIPETSSLPVTLGEVGLDPAPIIADNPDFTTFGSGDSFDISKELVDQVFVYPTIMVLGFQADVTSAEELSRQKLYSGLPAFEENHAYDLPYWAHRADFLATMELLDLIEKKFG